MKMESEENWAWNETEETNHPKKSGRTKKEKNTR